MAEKMLEALGRELRYFEYKIRRRSAKRKKEKENRISMHFQHRKHQPQIKESVCKKSVTQSAMHGNQKFVGQSKDKSLLGRQGSVANMPNPFAPDGLSDEPSSSNTKTSWEATFENQHKSYKNDIDNIVNFDPLNNRKRLLQPSSSQDLVAFTAPRSKLSFHANKLPLPSPQISFSRNNPFLESETFNDPWSVSPTSAGTENAADKLPYRGHFNPFQMNCSKPVDDEALDKIFGPLTVDERDQIPPQPNKMTNRSTTQETGFAIDDFSTVNSNKKVNNFLGFNTEFGNLENLVSENSSITANPQGFRSQQNPFESTKPSLNINQKSFNISTNPTPELSVIYQSSSLASQSRFSDFMSGSPSSNTVSESHRQSSLSSSLSPSPLWTHHVPSPTPQMFPTSPIPEENSNSFNPFSVSNENGKTSFQ